LPNTNTYYIYGIRIASEISFHYPLIPADDSADVVFSLTDTPPVKDLATVISQTDLVSIDTPLGHQQVLLLELENAYALEFTNHVTFWITKDTITAFIYHLVDPAILDQLLFGPVLAFWFWMRGLFGLHAAAVAVHEKAALFSASNQSGKSSLAASCLQVGHALLADDFASITKDDGEFLVQPGYPQMRMWEDQAAYFIQAYENLEIMRETYPKRLVPIGQACFGQFSFDPRPLKVIYVPQRRMAGSVDQSIRIEPLAKAAAVTTLMRSGAVTYFRGWLPFHQHNVQWLAELVKYVPVRRISYPSGYDLLPSVRDTILEDIDHL
jgi:hypothetical protein